MICEKMPKRPLGVVAGGLRSRNFLPGSERVGERERKKKNNFPRFKRTALGDCVCLQLAWRLRVSDVAVCWSLLSGDVICRGWESDGGIVLEEALNKRGQS